MKVRPSIVTVLVSAILVCTWVSSPSLVTVQTPEASPAADPDRAAQSFAFYPLETGFGSFFAPTIDAGGSAEMTALLANSGSVAQELQTYSANAYTAQGGGFEAAEYGTPVTEVATWLAYDERTLALDPGEGAEITFTVTVPEGTGPGQYIAAVAAEPAEASDVQGTGAFEQKTRYVVPVFITVPGETETGFEIGEMDLYADDDAVLIDVGIQNTGNIRVQPQGTVDIIDGTGALVLSLPVQMESIYAHESTVLTLAAAGALPQDTYRIRVSVSDPDTGATAADGEAPALTAANPSVTVSAAFSLAIDDTRTDANRSGYTISLQAGAFTADGSPSVIGPDLLAITDVAGLPGGTSAPGAIGQSLDAPVTVLTVASGAGAVSTTITVTIAMTLPPGTMPGTYSGGITFDVVPLSSP